MGEGKFANSLKDALHHAAQVEIPTEAFQAFLFGFDVARGTRWAKTLKDCLSPEEALNKLQGLHPSEGKEDIVQKYKGFLEGVLQQIDEALQEPSGLLDQVGVKDVV